MPSSKNDQKTIKGQQKHIDSVNSCTVLSKQLAPLSVGSFGSFCCRVVDIIKTKTKYLHRYSVTRTLRAKPEFIFLSVIIPTAPDDSYSCKL